MGSRCAAAQARVLRTPSLLREISIKLLCADLLRAAQSCRDWREAALERELWHHLDLRAWARQTFLFFSRGARGMNTEQVCAFVQLLKPSKAAIDPTAVMRAWDAEWVDGDTLVTEPAFVERLPQLLCRAHAPQAMVARIARGKPVVPQVPEHVKGHIASTGQGHIGWEYNELDEILDEGLPEPRDFARHLEDEMFHPGCLIYGGATFSYPDACGMGMRHACCMTLQHELCLQILSAGPTGSAARLLLRNIRLMLRRGAYRLMPRAAARFILDWKCRFGHMIFEPAVARVGGN